jgi:ATP-dependent Clp protease ATP-binding subunit ClpA
MVAVHPLRLAAFDEAIALGHRRVGEEHLLLALLANAAVGSLGTRLADLGLTHQALVDGITARVLAEAISRLGTDGECESGRSYHTAVGRARGLALGFAQSEAQPEHYLVAAVWDEDGMCADLLRDLSVDREEVIAKTGLEVSHPTSPLLVAAQRQVSTLDWSYLDRWHMVLAALAGEPDSRARRALEVCGLTHTSCASWLAQREFHPPALPRAQSVTTARPNSYCIEVLGAAEGLAAAHAVPAVHSEHGLLAFLWAPSGDQVTELKELGTTSSTVALALAKDGVQLPAAPLPEPYHTSWGEPVYVQLDRLQEVIDRLAESVPVGSWGFNHHEGRAWIEGQADLDLRAVLGPLALPPA